MADASRSELPPNPPDQDVRLTSTSRVEAFSDGVFAIVITLLVLELRVPDYRPGGLWAGLLDEWSSYVAFLVSFVYVGVIWLNHHSLFRRIARMDIRLQWINLTILFSAVIVPFPTSVLGNALGHGGSRRDEAVAVVLYALTAAVMAAPWWGVFTYLQRHAHLLEPGIPRAYLRAQRIRPLTGLCLYVICGVGGWFVTPAVGLVCIAVVIVYHAVTSEGLRKGLLGSAED